MNPGPYDNSGIGKSSGIKGFGCYRCDPVWEEHCEQAVSLMGGGGTYATDHITRDRLDQKPADRTTKWGRGDDSLKTIVVRRGQPRAEVSLQALVTGGLLGPPASHIAPSPTAWLSLLRLC